jgi:hypothetical protein
MRRTFSTTEEALQSESALEDLQRLVNAGCNRGQLIAELDLAFLADESWEALVGMDLRRFKAVIKDIRDCAAAMDGLYRSDLIHRLSIEYRHPLFVRIYDRPTLPDQLYVFANAVEHYRELLGPKQKIRGHVWKARIVALVMEDTHKPHDREVSALIQAVSDHLEAYSEKAHQAWRAKHQKLIETMRQQILHRRKLSSPPLSPD